MIAEKQHTVTAFEDDMKFLAHKIAEMGGKVENMFENSVRALVQSDTQLATKVIVDDRSVDALDEEINDKAILIIAQRQPMAQDLREVFASLRISADLERIGDMAKSISKRVSAVAERSQGVRVERGLEHLSELASAQLKEVLDAYGTKSVERIELIRDRDEDIDAMYTSLFRELLTYMMEDPRNISSCTHMLFCAKNVERIGDHATNIAEAVHYMVTGEKLDRDRPRDDKTHKLNIEV